MTSNQTSTALVVRARPEDLARVETILTEFSAITGGNESSHFGRAFSLAAAIRALHQAITDNMMEDIMHLQGTGLGFLTDKDTGKPPGYPVEDVKLVAIEAALMGAHWVGNEFNIISCRPYLTKNFYTRTLREFPGLTDLRLSPGVPTLVGDKGALVPYIATWKVNGREMRIERLLKRLDDKSELDERIPIKVNSGMGADAILGKAERKIKAQIYNLLTGSNLSDGDVEDIDLAAGGTAPVRRLDDLTSRLEGKSEPQGKTAEPDATLIDNAAAAFNVCEVLSEVGKCEAEFSAKAKTDAETFRIAELAEQARERIRSTRGTRSNGGKQKELTGA